jgi:hypothetical protein
MKSFKEYITEAGISAERQESSFVKAVKYAVKKNGGQSITVKSDDSYIKNVVNAEKYSGRQSSGSEPYTDVQLFLKNGTFVNISMKGESAPSLAGGGLRGIEEIIPGIGYRFYAAAYKKHLKNKLKAGQKVPDTYGVLNDADKKLLVVGNLAMGGPIDYMYIGPMNVQSKFNDGVLTVNGKLTSAEKYADSHDLYFRLRGRREDQTFDPTAKYPNGTPKIYSKSPSRGDSAGRIVVTDKPASNRDIITF